MHLPSYVYFYKTLKPINSSSANTIVLISVHLLKLSSVYNVQRGILKKIHATADLNSLFDSEMTFDDLPSRLTKHQPPTTVLRRTTFIPTITLDELLKKLAVTWIALKRKSIWLYFSDLFVYNFFIFYFYFLVLSCTRTFGRADILNKTNKK